VPVPTVSIDKLFEGEQKAITYLGLGLRSEVFGLWALGFGLFALLMLKGLRPKTQDPRIND
jgi:hypothetical protein